MGPRMEPYGTLRALWGLSAWVCKTHRPRRLAARDFFELQVDLSPNDNFFSSRYFFPKSNIQGGPDSWTKCL